MKKNNGFISNYRLDYSLLSDLYLLSSPSDDECAMMDYIEGFLSDNNIGFWRDDVGNLYACKGESKNYPCIVAHVDEVHKINNNKSVVFNDDFIFCIDKKTRSMYGCGADDKNGIFICLSALQKYDIFKCVFFISEEVGCIGSSSCDMDFFDDVRFVLQCDRRGNSDFINNISGVSLCSNRFKKDVNLKQFGYKCTSGMMTDVWALKENYLTVSCCNISCGYYHPHTNGEITDIRDLNNCFNFVCNIVEQCTKVYKHNYNKPVCDYSFKSSYNSNHEPDYSFLKTNYKSPLDLYYHQYGEAMAIMEDKIITDPFFSVDDFFASYEYKYQKLEYGDFLDMYKDIIYSLDFNKLDDYADDYDRF